MALAHINFALELQYICLIETIITHPTAVFQAYLRFLCILLSGPSQVGVVDRDARRSSGILVSFWHQMWELESGQSRDLREDGLYGFGEPGSGFRS